jgi:uncharacterized damage-inducible protein DinB
MDAKATAWRYLTEQREAVLWKVEGLSERDQRMPLTPTGTNLLGLVKHLAGCEAEYFGVCLGRPWPEPMAFWADDAEPNDDMWATAEETREQIVGLYAASGREADATIADLELESPGRVPWWPDGRNEVTLGRILVHMIAETAHHAGHADIVREMLIGTATTDPNLPEWSVEQWAAYRSRLERIAETAAAHD